MKITKVNELVKCIFDSKDSTNYLNELDEKFSINRAKSELLINKIENIVSENPHGYYFQASRNRYVETFNVLLNYISNNDKVLDIGNAPGHIAIGIDNIGGSVYGINLNNQWNTTYPNEKYVSKFNVNYVDIEKEKLPFKDSTFDHITFFEVLEHIAITDPTVILKEFYRVLKPGGYLFLSTPNVTNISNVFSLISGNNIFWENSIFYGSTDRHNREYTPKEVKELLTNTGFNLEYIFGINCDSNWRSGSESYVQEFLKSEYANNDMTLNTIFTIVKK